MSTPNKLLTLFILSAALIASKSSNEIKCNDVFEPSQRFFSLVRLGFGQAWTPKFAGHVQPDRYNPDLYFSLLIN